MLEKSKDKMEELFNSDFTMIASKLFDKIVNDVKNSGLNFRQELTPFGAKISLKKTLLRNKDGNIIIPDPSSSPDVSIETLSLKNNVLENEIAALQFSMKDTLEELSVAQNNIKLLYENLDAKNVPSDKEFYPKQKYSKCCTKLEKEALETANVRDCKCQVQVEKCSSEVCDSEVSDHEGLHVPLVPQPLGSSKVKTAIHSGTRLIQPCSHLRFKRLASESSETCNDFSPSLVTHWSPLIESPHASKSYKPSFRSHYERLHSQGEAFLPDGDKLLKPRWKTLEAQFQREKDSCRQS